MKNESPIKRIVKSMLQTIVPSKFPPIVVASMGRSGSTLIHHAVREAVARERFGPFYKLGMKIVNDKAWDLQGRKLKKGVVYKTHALADEIDRDSNAKVIFLFGSASDAALSVFACKERYGQSWIEEHFSHLRAKGKFEDLGSSDVLRFEDQLKGWLGCEGVSRIALHYDGLWENQNELSKFVGVNVVLPTRKARSGASSNSHALSEKFKKTYGDLDDLIVSLPRCQVLD